MQKILLKRNSCIFTVVFNFWLKFGNEICIKCSQSYFSPISIISFRCSSDLLVICQILTKNEGHVFPEMLGPQTLKTFFRKMSSFRSFASHEMNTSNLFEKTKLLQKSQQVT